MANNTTITAGSGTTIATDDVSGVHIQIVKLADGTEDSAARIPGDATNGLDVDVTRVIPGTGATSLGKAEDTAHVSGDTGVAVWAVRKDTPTLMVAAEGSYSPLETDAKGRLHVAAGSSGSGDALDGFVNAPSAMLDAAGVSRTLAVVPFLSNGVTWDMERGNLSQTLLASAARTVSTTTATQTNYSGRGVLLVLDATVQPGGGQTLGLKIQAMDPVSGAFIDYADAGVVLTAATGTKALLVYPGVLAADLVAGTFAKSAVPPRFWRPVVVHSGAGSWTYSLGGYVLV